MATTSEGTYQLAEEPAAAAPASASPADRADHAPGGAEAGILPERAPIGPPPSVVPEPPLANGIAGRLGGSFKKLLRSRALTTKSNAPTEPQASPETPAEPDPAAPDQAKAGKTERLRRRRKRSALGSISAWGVSMIVHVVILSTLALATLTEQVRTKLVNLNSSMFKDTSGAADELTKIYADQSSAKREQAVGTEADQAGTAPGEGGGSPTMALSGGGLGAPSATPRISAVGKVGARGGASAGAGNGAGLSNLKVIAQVSGLSLMPATPGKDLGGGGGIAGDVTFSTGEIGEALDQLSREILRQLSDHRLTVVWLFDESGSMRDDQQAIKTKFDHVTNTLKQHVDSQRKAASALQHVVVGFGKDIHFVLPKPSAELDLIGKAIDHLRVDESGEENVLHAIQASINRYSNLIGRDRRLLIVLVTDESGDDGSYIEEARQLAVSKRVPIYVIGRQALFGATTAHLEYKDPVTGDVYWPGIRRGPETADLEQLQWDGLHERWDEQPSGFAPFELARLAKDTGGIYFLLPSEEKMRVRKREQAYSMNTLKEYVPDYDSRAEYDQKRQKSEFRRTLREVIDETRPDGKNPAFKVDRYLPVDTEQMVAKANLEGPKADLRFQQLKKIEQILRKMEPLRDREPEKRWQANYDLMLAQVVAYEVQSFELGACLADLVKRRPGPKAKPGPNLTVVWELHHSKNRKAAKEKTEKLAVEAERLLRLVIQRHPKTPWADLAQDELDRGFGIEVHEWTHSPKYSERAKLVPKY